MVQPSSEKAKYLKKMGRITFNGHQETWYSQRKLPGKGLKIPGRHVGKDGFVMDKNDNISVATKIVGMNKKIKTYCGQGVRYDTCPTPNVVDLYVDW